MINEFKFRYTDLVQIIDVFDGVCILARVLDFELVAVIVVIGVIAAGTSISDLVHHKQ